MGRGGSDFGAHIDAAARIYMQHWIIKDQLGFLLDPSIPLDCSDLKVADLACGTGVWLVELAKKLPPTSHLDGFDISSAHFPPNEELPKNVRLDTLDSLAPVPECLGGKYDVVHCRGLMLYVQNGDPGQLVENMKAMLKPGGIFQWEELDVVNMYMRGGRGEADFPNCAKYLHHGKNWMKKQGIQGSWVEKMSSFLLPHQVEIIRSSQMQIGHSMAQPWTIMQAMATRDFIEHDIIPTSEGTGLSAEGWREVLENFPKECQAGARVLLDMVWVVGKKQA